MAGRPAGKSVARAPEEIFNLAEEALESAKKAGGNRVAAATA